MVNGNVYKLDCVINLYMRGWNSCLTILVYVWHIDRELVLFDVEVGT